ncbi:MAG: AAA family ATPase, partial [Actinomycetota bacterium]|nr:AAA family ATPase [Actinomycetota bacterium]
LQDHGEDVVRIGNHQPEIEAFLREQFPESAAKPRKNGRAVSAPTLEDDEIIHLCRKAKNAPKFASLFDDGDISAYDYDDSDADAGLLSIFAFYTQDTEQLDRLLRRSALYRSKWERRDYRERTINFVLENLTETYQPTDGARLENVSSSASPLRENDDDRSDEVPGLVCFANRAAPDPVDFFLERAAPLGYLTNLHGAGGFGKSVIAMLIAISVASGQEECIGLKVLKHGPALYLDSELDERGQHPRVQEICNGLGIAVPEDLHYLSALGLDTETAFRRAYRAAKNLEIALLVVDSWGPLMDGDMESARDVIRFYNNYLKPFVDLGVSVLIVDHQARTQEGQNYQKKGAFGSVYKENLARSVLQIERLNEDRHEGKLQIRVRHRKSNFGPRIEPFDVTITFDSDKIAVATKAIPEGDKAAEETINGRERVLAALRKDPATVKELAADTGLSTGTVRNILSELVPEEVATAELDGRTKLYGLPDDIKNLSSSSLPPREDGDDDRSDLTVEAVLAEFEGRTPSRSLLDRYLADPDEVKFDFMAQTVLATLVKLPPRNHEPDAWRKYVPTVKEAVEKWKARS